MSPIRSMLSVCCSAWRGVLCGQVGGPRCADVVDGISSFRDGCCLPLRGTPSLVCLCVKGQAPYDLSYEGWMTRAGQWRFMAPAFCQDEREAPALPDAAEFLFACQPAHPHQQH